MSGIFISYRREDSTAYARLLSDTLADRFGSHLVFRDVDTMGPGVDFPTAIAEAVNECDVLLALIGEKWLTAEQDGRRRLDDENDYVRLEIAAALERGILVVPILLEGTRMPSRSELPEALARLANRNAHRLTDESWSYGVDRLVTALRKVVAPPPPPPPPEAVPEVTPEAGPGPPAVAEAPPPPTSSSASPPGEAPPARTPRIRPLRAPHPAPPPEPPPAESAPADRAPSEPPPAAPPAVDRRRRVAVLGAVGVVVLLAVIGLAVGLSGGGGDGDTGTGVSTESTEVTQETAVDVEPRLDISPSVVTAGETVTMRGQGFQPNEKVVILYGGEQIYEFVADANGRFWETDDVPELESGTYDFQAKGTESGRTADASVEVA